MFYNLLCDDQCCQIFDLTTRKSCQTKYLTTRVLASTWWTQNRNLILN